MGLGERDRPRHLTRWRRAPPAETPATMRRTTRPLLAAALAALVLFPACDSGGAAERPSFRLDVTGDVEATLTGRPRVGVAAFEPGDSLYTFVLQSGFFSSVGLSVAGAPRVGTYDAGGAIAFLLVAASEGGPSGDEPRLFFAEGGEIVVESVEGRLVRARFAFDAAEAFDGSGRQIRVEGTMTADLADRLPTPTFPVPPTRP